MEEHGKVSGLYQKNLERFEKNKRWRDAASIVCILLGSFIVAVNMNTFVEQGKLVPGGFSGLAKLLQRVGLTVYDTKISFTLLNVVFNAVPAVFAYRLVGKKFTILSCVSLFTVSILVDELPVIPITGGHPADFGFRGNHQWPGHEPCPEQQCQRRRNGLYCHVPVRQVQGIHI